MRRRARIASQERAAQDEQLRLKEEFLEITARERVERAREEQLRERSEMREKSRETEAGRVYSALLERM